MASDVDSDGEGEKSHIRTRREKGVPLPLVQRSSALLCALDFGLERRQKPLAHRIERVALLVHRDGEVRADDKRRPIPGRIALDELEPTVLREQVIGGEIEAPGGERE